MVRGSLSPACAGLLAAVAVSGISVAVVSSAASVGKSTLLRALLEFAPDDSEVIYLRGWHDPFDFLETQSGKAGLRLLVANELSPHLPTYVWGDSARCAFEVIRHPGYALWATAHAANRDELQSLVGPFVQPGHDHSVPWDPVVVSLTPIPGHNRQGWSQITIDLGGNSARVSARDERDIEHYCAGAVEPRHLCHAVISEDDGPTSYGLGKPNGLERDFAGPVTRVVEWLHATQPFAPEQFPVSRRRHTRGTAHDRIDTTT